MNNKKNLNVRSETVKLLQERKGRTLEHKAIDNNFLNRTSITQQFREKTNNEITSNKKLLQSKGNSHQTEKTVYRLGENLCQLYT
jgi:hypothetical protein